MSPIEVLGIDHIDLTVNHVPTSLGFYRKVFGELGFREVAAGETSDVTFANGLTSFALRGPSPEQQGARFDRYRVGLHHLALRAAQRQHVDAFHAFLLREGLPVLDAPAAYPQYGEDYYALFFPDPDGLKLELAHYPWGYWRVAMTEGGDSRPRFPRGRPRS
jgi:catechol 2,3-dioxygenase-like lactoylglutathione lyase family enzyme